MNKKLRFAALIRVSTEKQEERGESLETQKKQLLKAVNDLGGVMIKDQWRYTGQESGVGILERELFNQLLQDAKKNIFDAVIVTDATRWSRNNEDSERGLRLLQENKKRFFIGTMEYDLCDTNQRTFLALSSVLGQFQANSGAEKSIRNRIERAKRGIAVVGRLPVGRLYNKQTGEWTVNIEYQAKIKAIAEEYVSGKERTGLKYLGRKYGISASHLLGILTKQAGSIWIQNFKVDRFRIDEKIETTIPALLDESLMEACRQKAKKNKTIYRGEIIHKYLLGKMIFCQKCGRVLYGTYQGENFQYYRHEGKNKCFHSIRAKRIEEAVIVHLFVMLGDVAGVEKAIKEATTNYDDLQDLAVKAKELQKEISKLQVTKDKIIDAIGEGIIEKEDAKRKMQGYKERETLLNSELQGIESKLENVMDNKTIKKKAETIKNFIRKIYKSSDHLKEMDFDEKRAMLQMIFDGQSIDGKRLGVYVEQIDGDWQFKIIGNFVTKDGRLSQFDTERKYLLDEDESLHDDHKQSSFVIYPGDSPFRSRNSNW